MVNSTAIYALLSCSAPQIRVPAIHSVCDAFAAEVVKLSPPLLKAMDMSACCHLHKLVLSPQGACPALETLNLNSCPSLEYVLVQSSSLIQLNLHNCGSLTKVSSNVTVLRQTQPLASYAAPAAHLVEGTLCLCLRSTL